MIKFQKGLDLAETYAVTATLTIMTIVVFIQVLFRTSGGLETYCKSHDIEMAAVRAVTGFLYSTSIKLLSISEELARYMMVWTVFIGGAIGAKVGAHVGLEAFISLFPVKLARLALLVSGIISMGFCFFLAVYGGFLAKRIISTGQTSPALEIPMGLVYTAVPVGAFLMACHFLFAGIDKYRAFSGASAKGAN